MSERIEQGLRRYHAHSARITFSGAQALQQSIEAERWMRDAHEKLIAAGWEWDGMDGYSKTVEP